MDRATLLRGPQGAPQVSCAWVLSNLESARLVDVREPDEFTGPLGHLPGAELVPLGDLADVSRGWPRDELIVLVCRSSGRSDRAALQLQNMGFSQVASMRGGMLAVEELSKA